MPRQYRRSRNDSPLYIPNAPVNPEPDPADTPAGIRVELSDPRWKRERKNFTQIHNDVLRGLGKAAGVHHSVRMLYCILLSYAWDTGYCFPSQETLAQHMDCTTRTIRRYLATMQEHKLVSVKRRGLGDSNIYHLEPTFD